MNVYFFAILFYKQIACCLLKKSEPTALFLMSPFVFSVIFNSI